MWFILADLNGISRVITTTDNRLRIFKDIEQVSLFIQSQKMKSGTYQVCLLEPEKMAVQILEKKYSWNNRSLEPVNEKPYVEEANFLFTNLDSVPQVIVDKAGKAKWLHFEDALIYAKEQNLSDTTFQISIVEPIFQDIENLKELIKTSA